MKISTALTDPNTKFIINNLYPFALVATPPNTPQGCDFYLNEFFVLRSFRGRGVAEASAVEVFNKHQGTWELQTNPGENNKRAQAFWRRTIRSYATDYNEATAETNNYGVKMIFRFENKL